MANKRKLKKTIDYVCNELLTECIIATQYGGKTAKEDVGATLKSIVAINSDYIRRVSHPEPGMPPKIYFKSLRTHFQKSVVEVIDQISYLYR